MPFHKVSFVDNRDSFARLSQHKASFVGNDSHGFSGPLDNLRGSRSIGPNDHKDHSSLKLSSKMMAYGGLGHSQMAVSALYCLVCLAETIGYMWALTRGGYETFEMRMIRISLRIANWSLATIVVRQLRADLRNMYKLFGGHKVSMYTRAKVYVCTLGTAHSNFFIVWVYVWLLDKGYGRTWHGVGELIGILFKLAATLLMSEVLLQPRIAVENLDVSYRIWRFGPLIWGTFIAIINFFVWLNLESTAEIFCYLNKAQCEAFVPFVLLGLILQVVFWMTYLKFTAHYLHHLPIWHSLLRLSARCCLCLGGTDGCCGEDESFLILAAEEEEEEEEQEIVGNQEYAILRNSRGVGFEEEGGYRNNQNNSHHRNNTSSKPRRDILPSLGPMAWIFIGAGLQSATIVFLVLDAAHVSWLSLMAVSLAVIVTFRFVAYENCSNGRPICRRLSYEGLNLITPALLAGLALYFMIAVGPTTIKGPKSYIFWDHIMRVVLCTGLFIYLWLKSDDIGVHEHSSYLVPVLITCWSANLSEEIRHYDLEVLVCGELGHQYSLDSTRIMQKCSFITFSFYTEFILLAVERALWLEGHLPQRSHKTLSNLGVAIGGSRMSRDVRDFLAHEAGDYEEEKEKADNNPAGPPISRFGEFLTADTKESE